MILVTGATGNVGRTVVSTLSERSATVRAATRRPGSAPALPGVTEIAFDYGDRESVRRAVQGVEKLFVVAPVPSMESLLVDAAAAAGVAHIVKLSVWKAAEEAFTFGRWHRAAERHIEETGVPCTFLRPNGFMQNVSNFLAGSIKEQGALYQPAGNARVSFVDTRDVGRAGAAVLLEDGHAGKAYDLSGPEAITFEEIVSVLSDVLGKPVRYVDPGDDAARGAMVAMGAPPDYADAFVDLNHYYKTGALSEATPWVRALTGEEPTSFRRFAEDHVAAFR